MDWDPLVAAATAARDKSHSPYSHFAVGAAVLMEDGSIHTGCNVENRSFGMTICAERTAIVTAVSQGLRRPQAIAVVTDTDPPAAPCGACREVLAEFADELPVLLCNLQGDRQLMQLSELFPLPFKLPQ